MEPTPRRLGSRVAQTVTMAYDGSMTTNTELTDTQYDVADAIVLWLETHTGYHSRSVIARGIRRNYYETATVLAWLESNVMVTATGNRSWRKFSYRG